MELRWVQMPKQNLVRGEAVLTQKYSKLLMVGCFGTSGHTPIMDMGHLMTECKGGEDSVAAFRGSTTRTDVRV